MIKVHRSTNCWHPEIDAVFELHAKGKVAITIDGEYALFHFDDPADELTLRLKFDYTRFQELPI